eukprot:m.93763 g.93763  ORF g.93763 m.93763 type:complete len:899 (-) comp18337_c0_seq5:40-2736(-)
MKRASLLLLVVLVALPALAVDRNNFKKCDENSFCKRNRQLKDNLLEYHVDTSTLHHTAQSASFDLLSPKSDNVLVLTLTAVAGGTVRVRITERNPKHARYEVEGVLPNSLALENMQLHAEEADHTTLSFGETTVVVNHQPLRVDITRANQSVVSLNSRGLLNFESHASKPDNAEAGDWEETFKTHTDSKPFGPTSVGLDVSFPGVQNVYGIPEHGDSLRLKSTKDTDPYRLFNLDVFEYEINNPMALYGSIPFMVAHKSGQTSGVFLLNSSEMYIDIDYTTVSQHILSFLQRMKTLLQHGSATPQTDTHWFAESGVIDMFVLTGPTPADVFAQYAALTGLPYMPPLFSIAYHQCRWNYNDEADVAMVDEKFDAADIPMDVLWLDIEHTDGKRYMTWDSPKFPNPADMQHKLNAKGRKMVLIVDPHIKRVGGYTVHDEATRNGYYIKNKDNNEYEGWCWPGSSSWLDFLNPVIRQWWADLFALDKYIGTTQSTYFWNDMNEPSVFNGPEITMHKDAKHYGGWEHRDVHNAYGMWQQASTAAGIIKRSGGSERPFVLSRAFFAGSQNYGAIWTGDNTASWTHLAASIPMLLSVGVAGLPFVGADIGGFFGNPDTELLVRWYQVGAYQPFMRAHAHLDTKRREPYLLEEKEQAIVRDAVRQRYMLLPYWYTLFYDASATGLPVMRPLWVEFPTDEQTFAVDTQFMVGSALLVAPVLQDKTVSVQIYFPEGLWYDVENYQTHQGPISKNIAATLRKVPVFQRGGTIIPKKMRVRRSSSLSHSDPFTLVVAVGAEGEAEGSLYVDDYHTLQYQQKAFLRRKFEFKDTETGFRFVSSALGSVQSHSTKEWVERVVVMGMPREPKLVTGCNGEELSFRYESGHRLLEIKKPAFLISTDCTLNIAV